MQYHNFYFFTKIKLDIYITHIFPREQQKQAVDADLSQV